MGRIMAIDVGLKRVGLAVTDPGQRFGFALETVAAEHAIAYIVDYASRETVSRFLIGYPKDLRGASTHGTPYAEKFARALRKALPDIPQEFADETFTSKMALENLVAGGVKKKQRRNKSLTDSMAAALILQEYLQNL